MVLARIPDTGAQSLTSYRNPGSLFAIPCPDEAAAPGWPDSNLWFAMIINGDGLNRILLLRGKKMNKIGVAILFELLCRTVLNHAIQHQRLHQIDLHAPRSLLYLILNCVIPFHRAVGVIEMHMQVIMKCVPPFPFRGNAAPQRVCTSILFLLRAGLSACRDAQKNEDNRCQNYFHFKEIFRSGVCKSIWILPVSALAP